MFAADYRNGSDIASDNYSGRRRTAIVHNGQGPLAALADLGLNSVQQQAGYGYLLKTGQVQIGRNGVPMVQPGQELHIDLDDQAKSGWRRVPSIRKVLCGRIGRRLRRRRR